MNLLQLLPFFQCKRLGDYADGIDPDVMLNNQNSSYEDDIDNVFPYAFGRLGQFDFNYPLYGHYAMFKGGSDYRRTCET